MNALFRVATGLVLFGTAIGFVLLYDLPDLWQRPEMFILPLGFIHKKIGKVISKIGGVAKKAAPFVGMIPGVGPIAAGALGGLGGLVSGGFGGALKGAAGGAAGGFGGKLLQRLLGGRGGGGGGLTPEQVGIRPGSIQEALAGLGAIPGARSGAGGGGGRGGAGGFLSKLFGGVGDYISQDPLRALGIGLSGLGAYQGAQQQSRANKFREEALGMARERYASTAPFREAVTSRALALDPRSAGQRPDLGDVFRNTENPFSRSFVPRETGSTARAASRALEGIAQPEGSFIGGPESVRAFIGEQLPARPAGGAQGGLADALRGTLDVAGPGGVPGGEQKLLPPPATDLGGLTPTPDGPDLLDGQLPGGGRDVPAALLAKLRRLRGGGGGGLRPRPLLA